MYDLKNDVFNFYANLGHSQNLSIFFLGQMLENTLYLKEQGVSAILRGQEKKRLLKDPVIPNVKGPANFICDLKIVVNIGN